MTPTASGTDRFEARVAPWRRRTLGAMYVLIPVAVVAVWIVDGRKEGWPDAGRVAVGALLVVGFAALMIWANRRVFDRRPQVAIDAAGIDVRSLKLGPIPWSDVAAVGIVRRQQSQRLMHALTLTLNDPAPWVGRLSSLNRSAQRMFTRGQPPGEAGHLTIPFTGLHPGLMPAVEFIVDRLGLPVDDPNV